MILRGLLVWLLVLGCTFQYINAQCTDPIGSNIVLDLVWEEELDVTQGSNVCVNLSVSGFDEICSVQFVVTWDPTVLEYTNAVNSPLNPALIVFSLNNDSNAAAGNLGVQFILADPTTGQGVTLPDGSELFTICFNAIGNPGDSSNIQFTDNITNLDDPEFAYCPANNVSITCAVNFTEDAGGLVTIGCNNVFADVSSCLAQPGLSNGVITLTACGGAPNPNYSYSIDGGPFIDFNPNDVVIIDNQATGSHSITVTDNNGDVYSTSINVGSGQELDAVLVPVDPTCITRPDYGELSIINLTGGTPPYTYAWSNFEFGTDMLDRMEPGTYTVTITDINGCSLELTETINLDTLKVEAVLIQPESCSGEGDAMVQLTASGGSPFAGMQYEFNNNPPSPFQQTFTGMPGGQLYFFQVEDSESCVSEIGSIFIPIVSDPIPIVLATQVSCKDAADGSICAYLDGSGENIFALLTGPMGNVINGFTIADTAKYQNLIPGDYIIEITERIEVTPGNIENGCMVMTTFTITEPEELIISLDTDITENPSCAGGDGKIGVRATGGTAPYIFTWDTGFIGNPICDLSFGDYIVTVTDANGCEDILMHTLTDSGNMLDLTIMEISPPLCPGGAPSAILEVTVNTGGSGFMFNWAQAGGPTLSTTENLNNIGPGEYFVTVTDALECIGIDSFTIATPSPFVIDTVIVQPTCADTPNGSISIIVDPATPNAPYTYLWDNPSMSTNALLPALVANQYNVTITDVNMCDTVVNFVLTGPPPVLLSIDQVNTTQCNGEDSGSIIVSASGGGQGATSFQFTVQDETGAIIYSQPSNSPHTITGLPAGNLSISAADTECSSAIQVVSILEIASLSLAPLTPGDVTEPTCFGDCDGSVSITAQGGSGGYNFTWLSDGSVSNTNNNLCAGQQYVLITDSNNCSRLDSFILDQPDTLIASINTVLTTDISCASENIGQIAINVTGGSSTQYIYNWNPNVSTNNLASNLGIGMYVVTVSDAVGCTDTVSYTLSTPPAVTAFVPTPLLPECFGESTCITVENVSGGVGGPYTFSVDNSPNIAIDSCYEVISDFYNILVFDAEGCAFDTTIFVQQPMELIADFGVAPDPIQLGDSMVVINLQISNEFPIDTIIWTPNEEIDCQDPLCQSASVFPSVTTNYVVTVFDINGCSTQDNILIEVDDSRLVFIPNTFSPNNDGINDKFLGFTGQGVEAINVFQIYDRWGNMLYEERGTDNLDVLTLDGWDGTFKDSDVDPGVFTYYLQVSFIDDRIIDYTGSFTLMR